MQHQGKSFEMLTHQYYEVFLFSVSRFPPPTQWSQCSRDELDFGLENGLGSCLDNNPTTVSVILLITYTYIHIYTHRYVCTCIRAYTCMHACIQTCEYMYIHIYTHTYIHVYSHTCT